MDIQADQQKNFATNWFDRSDQIFNLCISDAVWQSEASQTPEVENYVYDNYGEVMLNERCILKYKISNNIITTIYANE